MTHPVLAALFGELKRRRTTQLMLGELSGISYRTFEKWKAGHSPGLHNVEAALNSLGLHLLVVPESRLAQAKALAWGAEDKPTKEAA